MSKARPSMKGVEIVVDMRRYSEWRGVFTLASKTIHKVRASPAIVASMSLLHSAVIDVLEQGIGRRRKAEKAKKEEIRARARPHA